MATTLDGASKYLNNLLLARGFLQDGKAIDFPDLASAECETNRHATTARIINLIHDLVLRRDRDAEQRESLAATIHTLRAEDSQRVLDIQRLQDKNVHLKSELATSEAQQRSLAASAKRAQTQAKGLKEQMMKLKSTLDQVRAKCISDVRKRDVELEKLKHHLNSLNRGKKEPALAGTKGTVSSMQQRSASQPVSSQQDPNATGWCLENENNEFLAAVVNETSTENVALRKIVEDSMRYLKVLSGMEEEPVKPKEVVAIGIPGQYRDRSASNVPESLIPVQQLATTMSDVLAHVQTVLRDPSFVPIEEVQSRDEEIVKLKEGWEKMADRWKEAVSMMTQWRQNVMNEDEPIVGLHSQYEVEPVSFSRATRPNGMPVLDSIEEEELTSMLMEHYSRIGNYSVVSNGLHTDNNHSVHDETLPEPEQSGTPQQALFSSDEAGNDDLRIHEDAPLATPARRGIKLQKPGEDVPQPLSATNANAKKRKSPANQTSPRKRPSFSISEEQNENARPTSSHFSDFVDSMSTNPAQLDTSTPNDSDFSEADDDVFLAQDPPASRHSSKLPRMTVAEKLAVIEAEATEATEVIRRRQATTYDANDKRGKDRVRKSMAKAEHEAPIKSSGRQSSKAKKARDRRRSTLTPAELGTLMGR